MTDELAPALSELPEPVRQRLVALVAAGLPDLAVVPVSLRRIRDFVPARRARAGAAPITAALHDADFRAGVALVVPVEPGEDDPVTAAAVAWLGRPDGWLDDLAKALALLAEREQPTGRDDVRLSRLTERLEVAERALREARVLHREQLDEAKAENTRLRRTLGDERRVGRLALHTATSTTLAAELARSSAETLAAGRERELRQAQARLARYDAEAGSERRTARAERDEATIRARLLLDTVLDAATGLRRELALPSVSGTPAERVERGLGSEGVRDPSSSGVLGPDSSTLLDQLLTMPRARLVVDGYNVTKSVWGSLPLESQRIRLVKALAPLVARTGAETTVVFDAHQAGGNRPVVAAPRGVRVVFSPDGVIADDVIRDLVEVEPRGRVVVVVTGDAELAGDVRRDGARVSAPANLLSLLGS